MMVSHRWKERNGLRLMLNSVLVAFSTCCFLLDPRDCQLSILKFLTAQDLRLPLVVLHNPCSSPILRNVYGGQ